MVGVIEFITHVAASLGERAVVHVKPKYLKLRLLRRNDEARIVFCAILRVRTADQRYLLVRNLHRQESFSAFGGVYKYHQTADETLDHMEFRRQVLDADMTNDLRGFVRRKGVHRMIKWFVKNTDRESSTECLCRELKEEVEEARVAERVRCPDGLQFRKVWSIREGPEYPTGVNYIQLRFFDVFEIAATSDASSKFIKRLLGAARQKVKRKEQRMLLLASESEIRRGRAETGEVIGHPAAYLFTRRRVRPDNAPF